MPETSKVREKESKSKCFGCKKPNLKCQILGGILVIIAFYALLGQVIKSMQPKIVSRTTEHKVFSTADDFSCSANSFLLGDGTCDDITNTARCLFDGGDCCKQQQDISLCQECQCRQTVDKDNLIVTLMAKNATGFDITVDTLPLIKVVSEFQNVISWTVCTKLCLDIGKDAAGNPTDSWIFNSTTSTCSCTKITTFCRKFFGNETLYLSANGSLESDLDNSTDFVTVELASLTLKNPQSCNGRVLLSGGGFRSTIGIDFGWDGTSPKDMGQIDIDYEGMYKHMGEPFGALIKGETVMQCGGRNNLMADLILSVVDCYEVLSLNRTPVTLMKDERVAASGILVGKAEHVLFITGGHNQITESDNWLRTTEYVQIGEDAIGGPKLPEGMAWHCFMKINSTLGMVVYKTKVWYFDIPDASWIVGPSLLTEQLHSVCGATTLPNSEHVLAVVAGGGTKGNLGPEAETTYHVLGSGYDKTVIWSSSTEVWTEGPRLPARVNKKYWGMTTVLANKLTVFRADRAFILDCQDGPGSTNHNCTWIDHHIETRPGLNTDFARHFATIPIPDDLEIREIEESVYVGNTGASGQWRKEYWVKYVDGANETVFV